MNASNGTNFIDIRITLPRPIKKFKEKLVSIVVLNFNGKKYLPNCLSSISRLSYKNLEVIFVDNGSTDGSVEYVSKNFPRVRIIRNERNLGFAEGNNVGIKNSSGEIIALISNDVYVDPNWLNEHLKILNSSEKIGVTASKMLMHRSPKMINSAGGMMDIYGFGRDRGFGEMDQGQFEKIEETFYSCGGAMVIKAKILKEMGYFDPVYFIFHEDTDLCWRARLMGYKVIYIPSAIVYHEFGGTIRRLSPLRVFLTERNRLVTLIKNLGLRKLIPALWGYLALELSKMVFFTIIRQVRITFSILNALLWNVLNIRNTWKKRQIVQRKRKVDDTTIEKLMVKKSLEIELLRRKYYKTFIFNSVPPPKTRCNT